MLKKNQMEFDFPYIRKSTYFQLYQDVIENEDQEVDKYILETYGADKDARIQKVFQDLRKAACAIFVPL